MMHRNCLAPRTASSIEYRRPCRSSNSTLPCDNRIPGAVDGAGDDTTASQSSKDCIVSLRTAENHWSTRLAIPCRGRLSTFITRSWGSKAGSSGAPCRQHVLCLWQRSGRWPSVSFKRMIRCIVSDPTILADMGIQKRKAPGTPGLEPATTTSVPTIGTAMASLKARYRDGTAKGNDLAVGNRHRATRNLLTRSLRHTRQTAVQQRDPRA